MDSTYFADCWATITGQCIRNNEFASTFDSKFFIMTCLTGLDDEGLVDHGDHQRLKSQLGPKPDQDSQLTQS